MSQKEAQVAHLPLPMLCACHVCEKLIGPRDPSLHDTCPKCSRLRPVHPRCQAKWCNSCL